MMASLRLGCAGLVSALMLATAGSAHAQLFVEQQKVVADDAAPDDSFGRGLALSGGLLMVGAPAADVAFTNQGAVYVYGTGANGWSQLAKLVASDATQGDWFGISVAVQAGTAVIGAHTDNNGAFQAGSAYVFTGSGGSWTQAQKLGASDPTQSANFGGAVDIDGNYLVVGAKDAGGPGAAYVFFNNGGGWSEQQKLTPLDGNNNDSYGEAVAMAGDTLAIGAFAHGLNMNNAGAVYVYRRSGSVWNLEQKIVPGDVAADDYFGRYLDLDGDTLAIGASGDDDNGDASGSAYVYTRSGNTWSLQQKVLPADGSADDSYGQGITLSGDRLLVSAPWHDHLLMNDGAAYLWTRSGGVWTEQRKLVLQNENGMDFVRGTLALDGDWASLGVGRPNMQMTTEGTALYDLTVASNDGATCGMAGECTSGLCVDGYCCNSACGGGVPGDCQACGPSGSCEPETGVSCDDGDACTQTDTCNAGVCMGDDPVECAPLDECHAAGSCEPSTGVCDDPELADGTPCSGGVCEMGLCAPEGSGGGGGMAGAGGGQTSTTSSGAGGSGEPDADGGCSCRTPRAPAGRHGWWLLGLAAALATWRRRRA